MKPLYTVDYAVFYFSMIPRSMILGPVAKVIDAHKDRNILGILNQLNVIHSCGGLFLLTDSSPVHNPGLFLLLFLKKLEI